MPRAETRSIRIIAIVGVLAFVLLWMASVALRDTLGPEGAAPLARVRRGVRSPFDGTRALEDLERILALGPRPTGSAALEDLRGMIRTELERSDLAVHEHAFDAETPPGPLPLIHLVGVVQGSAPGTIVLATHYETKHFTDFQFIGANDPGASTAWMIEMARALGPTREGRTVWLCFLDGEESIDDQSDAPGLYGSRAFISHLRATAELDGTAAMINIGAIGDCLLEIKRDSGAPAWLLNIVWRNSRRFNYAKQFAAHAQAEQGAQIPFREAGVPAMNLTDSCYGPTPADHRANWHTANDTADKVCATSLQAVGDVIYHTLPGVDQYLDNARGMEQP